MREDVEGRSEERVEADAAIVEGAIPETVLRDESLK